MSDVQVYGELSVLHVRADEPFGWDESGADVARVELPSKSAFLSAMQSWGYHFLDRTLEANINLAKNNGKKLGTPRLAVDLAKSNVEELLPICLDVFGEDSRFIFGGPKLYEAILVEWLNQLDRVLICRHKGEPIGFLALEELGPETTFIKLAGVFKKYQASGVGMALYAKACETAMEAGYKILSGRISSKNMSVLNLYIALGATFAHPLDVFFKEIRHAA